VLPTPRTTENALSILNSLLHRVADGRAHGFWIEGEPGAGKTALLDLLAERALERGFVVLRCECPFAGEGDLPWARVLQCAQPALPLDILAAGLGEAERTNLGIFLSAPENPSPAKDPPGLRTDDFAQRRWKAVAHLLDLISRRAPLAIMINDTHRAGEDLARELRFFFRTLAQSPLLWILAGEAAAPEGDLDALRRDLEAMRRGQSLSLGPFEAEELRAHLAAWFDDDDLEALVPWMQAKTGGSPAFASEILRGLAEARHIARTQPGGRYATVDDLESVAIPANLEASLRRRLASLPPQALALLRALSALGGEGSGKTLRKLMGRPAAEIEQALQVLLAAGLVRHASAPDGRFCIRQEWLGRMALESAQDPQAAELCLRAAELLGADPDLPETIRLSRSARALERAGEQHWAAAAGAHAAAARLAWETNAQGAARAHIESALEMLDLRAPALRTPAEEHAHRALEGRILDLAGSIHAAIGPFAKAVTELERLREGLMLQRPAPRPSRQVAIDQALGMAHRNQGDYVAAVACLERALGTLRRQRAEGLRAGIVLELAWVHYERGDYEQALAAARRAGPVLRRHGASLEAARARNLEGLIAWAQCRYEEAVRIFQDGLKRLAVMGTVPLEAAVWNNLGLVHWNLGHLDEATRCLTRARRIRASTGQLWGEAVCLSNLALVEEDRGLLDAAARLHRHALRIRESLGDRRGIVIGLGNLADILRQTGEWDEGLALAERALAECRALGVANLEAGLLCTCAGLHRLLDRTEEALREAEQAIASARRFENTRMIAFALENAARALSDLGRTDEAREQMREARATLCAGSPIDLATILLSEAEMLAAPTPALRDEARASAEQALAIFEKLGLPLRIVRAREHLGAAGLILAGPDVPTARGGRRARVPEEAPEREGVPRATAPAEGAGRIRVCCFGPLRISFPAGKKIGPGDWGSHKARAIFAYLLFHRTLDPGVPRERILEAIWPDAPLNSVEGTYHATLAILRKTLAGTEGPSPPPEVAWAAATHSGGCYRLAFRSEPWIDCVAFEDALREGERWQRQGNYFRALAALRQAEVLYLADFLEDSYQDWTDPLRDRYRRDYADLLFRLGSLALETWRPAEAVEWSSKLLALDPLEERGCRVGMHAQVALGHRRAALDLYQRFAKRLKDDMGAQPEALTVETDRRIRVGQPLPVIAPPPGVTGPPARSHL
jgi:tetratricopeptide (TPR) repeat protein